MGLQLLLLLLCFGLVQHLTLAIDLGIARGKHACAPLLGEYGLSAESERQSGRPCSHKLAAQCYTR